MNTYIHNVVSLTWLIYTYRNGYFPFTIISFYSTKKNLNLILNTLFLLIPQTLCKTAKLEAIAESL